MAVVESMAQVVIESAKCPNLLVAACTGEIAILAQDTIIKKFSSKGDPFFGKGVVGKIVNRLGPACGYLEFNRNRAVIRRRVLVFFTRKEYQQHSSDDGYFAIRCHL
jgi:hypothetical protein